MMEVVNTISTVLTSAVVSGAVTVVIEVVAKPRMDARKERILSAVRSRTEFQNNLLRLEVASGMWARVEYPPEVSDENRKLIDAERARAFDQLDSISKELVDNLGFYALTYFGVSLPVLHTPIPTLIAEYVFTVRGIVVSSRTPTDKAKAIYELTEPIRIYLFGSKWHLLRRIKALLEFPALLKKHNSPSSSESRQAGEESSPGQGNPQP